MLCLGTSRAQFPESAVKRVGMALSLCIWGRFELCLIGVRVENPMLNNCSILAGTTGAPVIWFVSQWNVAQWYFLHYYRLYVIGSSFQKRSTSASVMVVQTSCWLDEQSSPNASYPIKADILLCGDYYKFRSWPPRWGCRVWLPAR